MVRRPVLHCQTVDGQQQLICLFNLSDEVITYDLPVWVSAWTKLLDSSEAKWRESGAAMSDLLPIQAAPGQTIQLARSR